MVILISLLTVVFAVSTEGDGAESKVNLPCLTVQVTVLKAERGNKTTPIRFQKSFHVMSIAINGHW